MIRYLYVIPLIVSSQAFGATPQVEEVEVDTPNLAETLNLSQVIRAIDLYLLSSGGAGDLHKRIVERNILIKKEFVNFRLSREAAWKKLFRKVKLSATISCGTGRTCDDRYPYKVPDGFDPVEGSFSWNNQISSYNYFNRSVIVNMRKSGDGSLTGVVWFNMKLSEATVAARVESEVSDIRKKLEALLLPTDRSPDYP